MKIAALAVLALGFALSTGAAAQNTDDKNLATLIRTITDQSDLGLRQTQEANGAVSLDLADRYQHAYIAQRDEQGALRAICVGSVDEANRFFGRDLDTGAALPQPKMSPAQLHDTALLHGMSPEEYAFYWGLIEQAKSSGPVPNSSTITILNNDGAGEGFNSAVATAAEGGNNGATLGAQRLNLFNFAAGIWSAFLDSTVTTTVRSNFDPLAPCSAGGGVLGSAGSININRDFANAPFTATWYPAALANKIAGSDLIPANPEISATFNSDVDIGCLGAGSRFYYGFDNSTPANRVNLLVVLLHELGHGFGFQTFTNTSTGAYNSGFADVWVRFMFDRTQNLTWFNMSAGQRAASAINPNNLLWDGPNVRIASGFLTAARDAATGRVELYTPGTLEPGSSVSHWNTTANPNLLMEPSINSGLPLTLDLTRQLMRDIGWFRDANNNNAADVISNVLPSGGSVSVGPGTTITWTNPPSFSRNVTIELSTDGGVTFPTTVAANIVNTGSFAWTVPNTPTAQARIRVREFDFVAPLGSSAANFTIGAANTAPSFSPAVALTRQRGSAAGAVVTVGTVADAQTPVGSLSVTQIAGGSATGMTVSGLSNNAGTVSAAIAAGCTANAGTLRFQVSDGSLNGTGDLQVNVTANTTPTLSYANANLNGGAGSTLNPASGPSDNGSIASIVVQSQGTYTGGISVNNSSGIISLSNAAPVGIHSITIRATDNCGSTADSSFMLTVNNTAPTFTPASALSRQQGSASGAAVTVGSVADGQTLAGNLLVTQIGGGTATGITVGAIVNSAGTISAPVSAACGATSGTVRFQVSDSVLLGAGNLQVNVLANTAPTLGSYSTTNLNPGGNGTAIPSAAPADNGSISSFTASISPNTFTGTLAPAAATGNVVIGNAGPVNNYTVTVQASDNCGSTSSANFSLNVVANLLFANGFE